MDRACRVEGKYCDWGWEKGGEGKVHFSAVDWFDHCNPYTHGPPFSFSLTHTHTPFTDVSLVKHEGLRLGLQRKSLNARYWPKRPDENNISLNQLCFFLSAFLFSPHEFLLLSCSQSVTLSVSQAIYFFGSLSLSACYSWHYVLFPRWWLIWETSHSALHIWNPFTRKRDLWYPLPGCLGLSQIPDQIPVEDTSLSLGVQVHPRLSGWTGTAHKQTDSQIQAPIF